MLSTFLFNVYVTALDNFIDELKVKHDKVGTSVTNPEFRQQARMDSKKFVDLSFKQRIKMGKFFRDKAKAEGIAKIISIGETIKINYVRYADNMLFGFRMNKSLAKVVIKEICDFIKSDLHLDCYLDNFKSKLIHGSSELITFLGFKIGLYPANYSNKSKHLVRFKKLKANLRRKKIQESEKYFKMQEYVLLKMHKDILRITATKGQSLIKKTDTKAFYDHRVKIKVIKALKVSLTTIESEILATSLVNHFPSKFEKNPNTPFALAERKRTNLLKVFTSKWLMKARKLVTEDQSVELQAVIGKHLSSSFLKARDRYLEELEAIFSKDFCDKVTDYTIHGRNKLPHVKARALNSTNVGCRSIRILFPKNEFYKKLRSFKFIHKVITRPIGVPYLAGLQDYQIVDWFALKANGIWNYYSCADNIWDLKQLLNWTLRYSMLGTLSMKHKSSIKSMISKHSLAPRIEYNYDCKNKSKIVAFASYPSSEEINRRKKEFNNSSFTPIEFENFLKIKLNIVNTI
jgi:Type II intron maturase